MKAPAARWGPTALCAALVLGAQAFVCRGLVRGELPSYRELSRLFLPLKLHLATELQAGRLPHWWPWDGLGMPLASQPMASLFHPSTALFAVLPFPLAFALQFFLPLPFAAWATWRLGRALGLRSWAACVAAAAYSLSGYFLCLTEFTFSSLAATSLPLVALTAVRLRTRWGPLMLAVELGLLLLAGDPVVATLAVGTALALSVRRRRTAASVGAWALAMGLGAVLAAVQWLPAAQLFFESSRAQGTVHGSTFWALGPTQLAGFVVPPPHAGPAHLFASTYLGVLTVALALVGALARGRSRVALWIVAGLSLGLAVGDALPLWKLASTLVPGWSAFRFPAKAMGPLVLVVALWAGRGAQVLTRRFPVLRGKAPRVAVVALVTLELAVAHRAVIQTAPLPSAPPLARTLADLGVSLEGASYAYRWQLPKGAPESTARQLATVAPSSGALHGLPSSNAYVPGFSSAYADLRPRAMWTWLGPLAPLFGSRYLVGTPEEDSGPVVARDDTAGAVVVELPGALPRAYLAEGVRRASRAVVPAVLRDPQFRPGAEVVLATEDAGPEERPARAPALPAQVRRVGDAAEVTVSAEAPSVLVLNEAWFDGVRAFEGERPLPVLRVNHLVRGVALEAGAHVVRFDFRTPGLGAGAALSAFGLAVLAALRWARRRRPRVRPA